MMQINFNFIDPDNQWIKPACEEQKRSAIKLLYKSVSNRPQILIPPACVLSVVLILSGASLVLSSLRSRLAPAHDEFELLSNSLKIINDGNASLSGQFEPAREFILDSVSPYIFAQELQTLVPSQVQLIRYELSTDKVTLEASSSSQKHLDDFVVFLSSHPLLNPESIKIQEITSSGLSSSESNLEPLTGTPNPTAQPKQLFNVKLEAIYIRPEIDELDQLLAKSGHLGLLQKLRLVTPK